MPADSAPHRSRLDQLMERRDTIYDNLRDLKFEYRTGKFAEQDYEQMKQTLETEAALVLAEIETVTGNQGAARRDAAYAALRAAAAAEAGRDSAGERCLRHSLHDTWFRARLGCSAALLRCVAARRLRPAR